MPKHKFIKFIAIIFLLLASSLIGCGASDAGDIVLSVVESETEEEVESETGTAKEASEMRTEENDGSYYFSPISYDLSNLPAMENKLYAEWDGKIYFRKYSDEDLEEGALWAKFGYVPGTEKEIMCLEPDGTLTQVGTDYGHGKMFVVGGRLYSQKYVNRKNGGDDDSYDSVVYSCELDGSGVIEYASSEVLALRGNWVICETRDMGMEGLAVINVQTGQERILVDAHGQGLADTKKQYWYLDYLGAAEEEIFYYIHPGVHGDFDWGNRGSDEDLILYSVDYEGNIRELTTVTCEEYMEYGSGIGDEFGFPMDAALHIHCFKILGDDIYFNVGSDNGSGQMYSGGPIFSMKKDGSERQVQAFSYDTKFYLYDDGVNRALLCSTIDNVREVTPVCLEGEAPQDIFPRIANGYSYDEPYVNSSKNSADSVLLYPDTSGICYVLLTERESEELSVDTVVDGHVCQDIKDVEYLGGKLFFTVTDLTYSSEDSIGWRDYYNRGQTACYCKDMENGKIRLLYEY